MKVVFTQRFILNTIAIIIQFKHVTSSRLYSIYTVQNMQ